VCGLCGWQVVVCLCVVCVVGRWLCVCVWSVWLAGGCMSVCGLCGWQVVVIFIICVVGLLFLYMLFLLCLDPLMTRRPIAYTEQHNEQPEEVSMVSANTFYTLSCSCYNFNFDPN